MEFLISPNFWSSVLASTTPVLLATLAANIMTKAGMFNLGIEGTMLMCALAGVLASAFTGSLFLGALLGVLLGILVSFVLGYFILKMNAPMNACGVAINLAATGGTVFILAMVCGSKNNSTSIVSASFPNINIPILKDIPVLGQILSGQNFVTYLSWIFVALTALMLYGTRLGVNIRAVGENEEAARSAGNSSRWRCAACSARLAVCIFLWERCTPLLQEWFPDAALCPWLWMPSPRVIH